MEQIERIIYMEQILDEGVAVVSALTDTLEQYGAIQDRLEELSAYYHSPQWLQDFDDDATGKLPNDLKRGVLSEDAVYHLLTELDSLKKRFKELSHQ